MKITVLLLICFLSGLLLFPSCSIGNLHIEKRHYRNGFYISRGNAGNETAEVHSVQATDTTRAIPAPPSDSHAESESSQTEIVPVDPSKQEAGKFTPVQADTAVEENGTRKIVAAVPFVPEPDEVKHPVLYFIGWCFLGLMFALFLPVILIAYAVVLKLVLGSVWAWIFKIMIYPTLALEILVIVLLVIGGPWLPFYIALAAIGLFFLPWFVGGMYREAF